MFTVGVAVFTVGGAVFTVGEAHKRAEGVMLLVKRAGPKIGPSVSL